MNQNRWNDLYLINKDVKQQRGRREKATKLKWKQSQISRKTREKRVNNNKMALFIATDTQAHAHTHDVGVCMWRKAVFDARKVCLKCIPQRQNCLPVAPQTVHIAHVGQCRESCHPTVIKSYEHCSLSSRAGMSGCRCRCCGCRRLVFTLPAKIDGGLHGKCVPLFGCF